MCCLFLFAYICLGCPSQPYPSGPFRATKEDPICPLCLHSGLFLPPSAGLIQGHCVPHINMPQNNLILKICVAAYSIIRTELWFTCLFPMVLVSIEAPESLILHPNMPQILSKALYPNMLRMGYTPAEFLIINAPTLIYHFSKLVCTK